MRLRHGALFALAAITLACAGCDSDPAPGNVREWRAEDHAQPAAPDPARQAPETAEAPSADMIERAAAALFGTRCASCHGAEGRGDGPEAPISAMPDLTLPAYHDGQSDADIGRTIRMGEGLMPAFGGQLNERGITALVGHVRRLRAEE